MPNIEITAYSCGGYADSCRLSNNNSPSTNNFSLYQSTKPAKPAHSDT